MNPIQTVNQFTDPILPVDESLTVESANIIPVIEEQLVVEKRIVETGRLVVSKTVLEEEETVDVPLLQEAFGVERVTVNRYVDVAPAVRYEGDTTIFPVMKEVLVTEKRLMLVEEIHVTKRQTTVNDPQRVTLRREEVTIQRVDSGEERSV